MKAILIFFLFLSSYTLSAQFCNAGNCVQYVTQNIENNYSCSGSWMPDVTACWGCGGGSGNPCCIMIWNNSTTEDLIVYLSYRWGSFSNITIAAGSCYNFIIDPIDGNVFLEFSSSSHENTCTSGFYMNCL
jgi:hypothetical protein